jgi:hypothetical protein
MSYVFTFAFVGGPLDGKRKRCTVHTEPYAEIKHQQALRNLRNTYR